MVLYKYAGDSGLKILEDLRLKITPPNECNDPFEISPHSMFTETLDGMLEEARTKPERYRKAYEAMTKNGSFKGSFEEFITCVPKVLSKKKFDEYKKLSKRELAKIDLRTPDTVS